MIFELDAQTLTGADGTTKTTWTDSSPNAYVFLCNSGKEAYLSNSVALLNNKHGMVFFRTTPTCYFKTNLTSIPATNYTVFVVAVGFNGSAAQTEDMVHLSTGGSAGTQRIQNDYNDGSSKIAYYDTGGGGFFREGCATSALQSHGMIFTFHEEATASGNIRTNGVTCTGGYTQNYTKVGVDSFFIGTYQDKSANGFSGIIANVRVYYGLAHSDVTSVERYLGYVYGISVP